jgi:hypothetical protein
MRMEHRERAEPISLERHTTWYHGSPLRLEVLTAGSTVTPIRQLAQAFSHKPTLVSITVHVTDASRQVCIEHDGERDGYLYQVRVADPEVDLRQHPGSRMAPGEEMLATRALPLQFLCHLPVREERCESVAGTGPGITVHAVAHRELRARLEAKKGDTA